MPTLDEWMRETFSPEFIAEARREYERVRAEAKREAREDAACALEDEPDGVCGGEIPARSAARFIRERYGLDEEGRRGVRGRHDLGPCERCGERPADRRCPVCEQAVCDETCCAGAGTTCFACEAWEEDDDA